MIRIPHRLNVVVTHPGDVGVAAPQSVVDARVNPLIVHHEIAPLRALANSVRFAANPLPK